MEVSGREAGCEECACEPQPRAASATRFGRPMLALFVTVVSAVLLVVVLGEWLGLLEPHTDRMPWYAGVAVVHGRLQLGGPAFAALGFLPPILAAAQSLPDLVILGNSSRLLRIKRRPPETSQ